MNISGKKRAPQEQHSKFPQLELLLDLTAAISQAKEPSEIYRAVAQGLVDSLSADRAAIMIFDPDDVLRFKETVGLSEEYRAAVEGHTPWRRGAVDAQPIVVSDVLQEASLSAYRQAFVKEGIRAIALIPLVVDGGLIGKFVLYHNAPYEFPRTEIRVAQAIATPVARAWARQQVEEALRDSEQRLLFAQSAARVGVWDCDLRTNVTRISGEYARLHGLAPDHPALTHEEWLGSVHPDDREWLKARLEESFEKTHSWDHEFRVVWPDGSVHWLLGKGKVFLDESDRPVRMAGVTLDITERRRAEEKFSGLLEAAPDAMVVTNGDGKIILVNSQVERLFGYRREELLGQKIEIFMPERYWTRHLGYRKDYFAQPRVRPMGSGRALRGRRKDGTQFSVEISLSHLKTNDELLVLAAIRDVTERERAEEVLRESQQHLVSIYNTVEDVIFYLAIEPEGQFRIVSVNAAFLRVTGLSQEAVVGKTVNEVIPEPSLTMVLRKYRQAIEENTIVRWEETSDYPSGRLTGEVSVAPVFDNTGTCTHLVGSVHDITEVKRALEALQQSKHMLATELDAAQHLQHVATQLIKAHATEALYEQVLDAAMAILHSDFASIQMFVPERGTNGELHLLGHRGFSAEAAKRWEWVRPTTRTTCGEALCTGRRVVVPDVRNCDFMSGSEDLDGYLGAEIHAGQSTPLVSRAGALLGMVTTYWREPHEPSATEFRALDVLARMAADLIERSRAEEKLRESEERFRNIADTAPIMIWIAGPDKLWTFVNKTCLDFTGHTLEHKLGWGWIGDIHPDDREQFLSKYHSAFDARQEFQSEIRARRADGEYLWMLTTGTPRFAPGFAGYIGSCVDLTEVKRTQEEALARQKLESLGVLAGGIAHDFNNLLGGIHSVAELVEMDLAVGSAARDEIQKIKTAAIRGSEIVRVLMIYAGENQKDLNEAVDVSRLVEEMLQLLKVSISKQVVLRTDFGGDLPLVRGNAPQIRQVVMNLVLNASEAIGDTKGVITLTAAQVSGGRDLAPNNATDLPPGDYVRIEVSDTGCGMPEEIRAKLFDPFFSTKFPGRGLGLAVVQGIVRDLGGAVNIVSAPGQGTVFQVLLPRAPKAASASSIGT